MSNNTDRLNEYLSVGGCKNGFWLDNDNIVYLSIDENGYNIKKKSLKTKEEKLLYTAKNTIWSFQPDVKNDCIFFTVDNNGNENEEVYMIKGNCPPVKLTDSPDVKFNIGWLTDDGETLIAASNERQRQTFDIISINTNTCERGMILENTDNYNIPAALSPNGKYLLYNKMAGQYNNALWMVDVKTGESRKTPSDDTKAAYLHPVWKNDSSGFYLITEAGNDFRYVAFYDISQDKLMPVLKFDWDVTNIALSPLEDYLAVITNEAGYSKLHIYSFEHKDFMNIPQPPKGEYSVYNMLKADTLSFSPQGNLLMFSVANSRRPHNIWTLDLNDDKLERITEAYTGSITHWDLILPLSKSFKSFDGLEVPYWLYVPKGMDGKNMPVVIDIHGGPEGQCLPLLPGGELFQYMLSQGIAVVQPNVRGSMGYGKSYEQLDNVEKRLDSVKDIISLTESLIAEGIADKAKIAVMGVSYGGFMTLSCAARYPDYWCCAVDTVGILNLETLLENTSAYRRPHRESEYGTLADNREMLRKVSPIAEIDGMKGPLLVIHGENDPRVPISESRNTVEYLLKRGVDVELVVYDDEGHGVAKLKNKKDCYPKILKFIKKHMKIADE